MAAKGYTNRTEVQNYLLTKVKEEFWAQVDRWIEQIERYIDEETGRNFIADSALSTRLFDGSGTNKQLIDDCVEISQVKLSKDADPLEDESGSEAYFKYPNNARLRTPPVPYTRLELACGSFPRGKQNIRVRAKWGYSTSVPQDIKFAATVLVAGIVNFSNDSEGEVQSMTIGRYSVTYKTKQEWQDFEQIQGILDHYRKYSV